MNRFLWILIFGQFAAVPLAAEEIDYSQLKIAHTLTGHEDTIRDIAVSPDGKTLATSSYDKTVRLWDMSTGKAKGVFRGQGETVQALRFSPDGVLLAAASKERTIRLWDVAAGKETATIHDISEKNVLNCVLRFSPDGRTLASATNNRMIRLWDVRSGKEKCTITTGHRARVREILFSPDGKTLASSGYYDLQIWDADGKQIGAIDGQLSTMQFSADGKTLTSAIGHRITHWSVTGGEEPVIVEGEEYRGSDRFRALLSPDGKTLATIDKDLMVVNLGRGLVPAGQKRCRLILMDVNGGNERTIVEKRGSSNWFGPIWYSPNGKALALWNWNDQSITLVDAATGKQQIRLTAPGDEKFGTVTVPPIAFAPNGKNFVAAHGSSIAIWAVP